MNNVGSLIYRLRAEHGLSFKKLAEKSGVADSTILKWETGESSPNIDKLQKVLNALGYKLQIVRK